MENSVISTIDMSNFPQECERLRQVCEEWGCFRIVNHSISRALMLEMKVAVQSLFDLPTDIKNRNTDVIAGSGYWAPTQTNPLYEALGLYDIGNSVAVDTFCDQLDASPHQREIISKYAKTIHELSIDLAEKIAQSLGLTANNLFEGWPSQFRINKYHFTAESVGSPGVQIHTDSGFLTILQDDENVGGLEAMDRSGEYVPADPEPGTLFVNLGDVATAWSNGRLRTVKHRVQCKQAALRYSIASFLLGPAESAVETPPELVDSEHPRLYVPFTFEDYRKLRLKTNLRAGEALELMRIKS